MGTPAPTPTPTPSEDLDPRDATTPDDLQVDGGDADDQVSEPVLVSVDQPRPGTRNPHQSRVRALKVLFQADLRGEDLSATVAGIATDPAAVALLDDLDDDADAGGHDGLDEYARTLIDGVALRRHAIDRIVSRFSHRWEVNRMPVVDRNILRLGAWELLFEDVSPAVVINEALELAKQHSTDASHRFVNGILEAVRRDADDLRAELTAPPPDVEFEAGDDLDGADDPDGADDQDVPDVCQQESVDPDGDADEAPGAGTVADPGVVAPASDDEPRPDTAASTGATDERDAG